MDKPTNIGLKQVWRHSKMELHTAVISETKLQVIRKENEGYTLSTRIVQKQQTLLLRS